jgi:hypothetical protein
MADLRDERDISRIWDRLKELVGYGNSPVEPTLELTRRWPTS